LSTTGRETELKPVIMGASPSRSTTVLELERTLPPLLERHLLVLQAAFLGPVHDDPGGGDANGHVQQDDRRHRIDF